MNKLKSKSGCRTCVVRKKKCDEAEPRCGNCVRLGLVCAKRKDWTRGSPDLVTPRSVKIRVPPLRGGLSNGYPPFASDLQKKWSLESCHVLGGLVSCMAGSDFAKLSLLVSFCAQKSLVREAIVAFSAYIQPVPTGDSHKVSLRSYQGCISQLKRTRFDEDIDTTETCFILTAVCFLGLLESLGFGNPSNALMHFEMCKRLLVRMVSRSTTLSDSNLMNLLRVIAECVMFNLATLSPFCLYIDELTSDWGSSLDRLFPESDSLSSPFLGGLHTIYRVMLRSNILLSHSKKGGACPIEDDPELANEYNNLWQQLNDEDNANANLYINRETPVGAAELYRAKHKLTILALRVQLRKTVSRSTRSTDHDIQGYVAEAIGVLNGQDIRETGNPALRWPLTILACAACDDQDFALITAKMHELEPILDPANKRKLASAQAVMSRQQLLDVAARSSIGGTNDRAGRFSLLLEPWKLDESQPED